MVTLAFSGGLGDIATTGAASGLMSSLGKAVTSLISPSTLSSLVASQDLGKLMGGSPSSEDCLFLDVVVPGKALRGEIKLPVVNWIYGGKLIGNNTTECTFLPESRCLYPRIKGWDVRW
jgi:hypothetical protein